MRKAIVMMFVLVFGLCGCDQFKGEKGATGLTGATGLAGKDGKNGTSTLLSTKIYTGTPTSNPYSVYCPEITSQNNQIVQVYIVIPTYGDLTIPLPYTPTSSVCHYYAIATGYIGLSTISSPSVSKALYDQAGGQCKYRIEIRTFATASAAQAYRNQNAPAKSTYDTLIYGAN